MPRDGSFKGVTLHASGDVFTDPMRKEKSLMLTTAHGNYSRLGIELPVSQHN